MSKKRGRGDRFVGLSYQELNSAAYKYMHPGAVCILIEVRKRYNGSNNGDITLSCREAAKAGHCSKSSAWKHLQQIEGHGFIKMNNKGQYGNRHATTWILTNQQFNDRAPTKDWQNWKPEVGQKI